MTVPYTYTTEAARISAAAIRDAIGSRAPTNAIILGSGLGGLADKIKNAVRIPFAKIPGFPEVTVVGHAGAVIVGTLGGCEVIALSGRFHIYEGTRRRSPDFRCASSTRSERASCSSRTRRVESHHRSQQAT